MGQCCTRFCMTLLTLSTVGLTLAIFAYGIVIAKDMKELDDRILISIIIALCVSALLFIFGLYSSWKGGKCARSITGLLFIIYGVALLGFAVLLFIYKNKVRGFIAEKLDTENIDHTLQEIEKEFGCCGLDKELDRCKESHQGTCAAKLDGILNKSMIVAGVSLGAGLLLTIATIFVMRATCKEESSAKNESGITYNQSLNNENYGW